MAHNIRGLAFAVAAAMLLGVGVNKVSAQVIVTRYAAPTVTYYSQVPATSYYVAPTVSYYTPTVSYYTPTVSYYTPTVSYYTPTVSYYTPATSYYAAPPATYYPAATRTHYGLFGRLRSTTTYYPSYVYP